LLLASSEEELEACRQALYKTASAQQTLDITPYRVLVKEMKVRSEQRLKAMAETKQEEIAQQTVPVPPSALDAFRARLESVRTKTVFNPNRLKPTAGLVLE
jgi:hypothetical protein